MVEAHGTKFAQVRPLGKSFRYGDGFSDDKYKFSYLNSSQNKSSEFYTNCEKNKSPNFISSQLIESKGHFSESDKFARKVIHRRAKSSDLKDESSGAYKSSKLPVSGSAMQTLDRRISASSDQLDTLRKIQNREKPLRTRSSSRISFERKFKSEESDDEETKPSFTRKLSSKHFRDGAKTPFEMFLEDDGPYSRKLYGPVTPKTPRNIQRSEEISGFVNKGPVRKEKIVYTSFLGQKSYKFEKENSKCPQPIRKGLLWQQKDKFFSRWKERFFILTEDYLQCFRKENSKISEMGTFLFKLKLSDVEDVSLLTKKGYLTISLSHGKDGRLFLRRHEGIKEWYSMIKANSLESKANRIQHDLSHNNLNLEAWLLARQTITGTGTTNTKQNDLKLESFAGINYEEPRPRSNTENAPGNQTRGINRISMVADLLESETVAALAHKNSDKHGDDSGLESGHTSMNNDSQSEVTSSGEDPPTSPQTQIPDIIRTSHNSRSNRCDSFIIQSSQRRNYYNKLPVTIV